MVDLHSHILFGIDDGANDIEETKALIERAKKAGIKKLFVTPHFALGDDVDEFLEKRNKRLEKVKEQCPEMEIKAGAEVYITDELFDEDKLCKLTMGEGKVILCEFKYHSLKPEKFLDYIDHIIDEGLVPLIAHVERYSFVRENPMLFKALIKRPVLLQVNAISFFEESDEGDFAWWLCDRKLIFAIGSDMHHIGSRRYRAMENLWKEKNGYITKLLWDNPLSIYENTLKIGDE